MTRHIPLEVAQLGLKELIEYVRDHGEPVILSVDGEPVAQIRPLPPPVRQLTPEDLASIRALEDLLLHRAPAGEPDDADLIREGNR